MEIRELVNEQEFIEVFPLLSNLRPNLNTDSYRDLLNKMRLEGYKAYVLFDNGKAKTFAGLAILHNFYYAKHIWVYDLVVDPTERSNGYGKNMMDFIESLALENECECIALSSGLQRERAHSFYIKNMRYTPVSYVFKKTFENN